MWFQEVFKAYSFHFKGQMQKLLIFIDRLSLTESHCGAGMHIKSGMGSIDRHTPSFRASYLQNMNNNMPYEIKVIELSVFNAKQCLIDYTIVHIAY